MDSTRNIYIAIVDDDESFCRSMSRWLRAARFQPVAYSSAEAFLEDAKRPQFDCLVLDLQLGGMSGLELYQRIAAVKDRTPVVFLTAHDDPAVREQAIAAGCAGYFRKTDSGSVVLAAIHHAIGLSEPGTTVRLARNPLPERPPGGE